MNLQKLKLHIFSFDGLSAVDMPFLQEQPNFKRLLDGASYSYNVKSVYPSLTYPAHTSIVTGNYPVRHGVINNTFLQPGIKRPNWFWHEKYIKTKTFQQLACENNYSILSLLWPVTAGAKLKYNMPEIFPSTLQNASQLKLSLGTGSKLFQIRLFLKFGKKLKGLQEPELDDFILMCWLYSYTKYPTDITMTHFIDLDSIRHDYGFSSPEAKAALLRHDKRLGQILDKIESSGNSENTTIIALGDHSSKDAHSVLFLNTFLKENGFLSADKSNIINYKVIAKSAGGSTYIYTNPKTQTPKTEQQKLFNKVKTLIESEIPSEAIQAIYTAEEAGNLGADNSCLMMIEANEGYLFEDGIADKSLISISELEKTKTDLDYHTNNHGYSPYTKQDFETVFIAKGKNIKGNFDIGEMSLVDEGPTFAKILGLDLKDTNGKVLDIFL